MRGLLQNALYSTAGHSQYPGMSKIDLKEVATRYRTELLDNVVPFWLRHSLDRESGGYFNCLNRDGSIWDTDKFLWMQGRELWMWSSLCLRLERRPEWEAAARHGAEFLRKHALDKDGRVPFAVTRQGQPLLKPRDIYAESFIAIGMAAYGKLTGEAWATKLARQTYRTYLERADLPETHDGSQYPGMRPVRVHGISFIRIALSQEMRRYIRDDVFDRQIERGIHDILSLHVHGDELFEHVQPDGQLIPGPMGRLKSPGHAVEAMGFILAEGKHRQRRDWIDKATDVIDRALTAGWDPQFGGILYFLEHNSPQNRKLEGDMKLWWVHTDSLYPTLLAWQLTQRPAMLEWFGRIDEWAWRHFRDREHGEWFGYLHRDGSLALPLKGSMWKCFFHLPRMLLNVTELLT